MISRRAKEIHPSIHLRLATSIRSRRPRLLVYRTGLFWGRFIASPFFFFFIFNSHGVVDLANFECRYNCCPHLYIFWYTFWLACLERWWSPRDPVLLFFILWLYLEAGFSIYVPWNCYLEHTRPFIGLPSYLMYKLYFHFHQLSMPSFSFTQTRNPLYHLDVCPIRPSLQGAYMVLATSDKIYWSHVYAKGEGYSLCRMRGSV